MANAKLKKEIIDLSNADNWDEARKEWKLFTAYYSEDPEICLCGHKPIKNICVIENLNNSHSVIIGNCCVKHFESMKSDYLFKEYNKLKRDSTKLLSIESIEFANSKGWINDWERDFYKNISKQRFLTKKQIVIRDRINNKYMQRMTK